MSIAIIRYKLLEQVAMGGVTVLLRWYRGTALLLLVLLCSACREPSGPEQAIREAIAALQQAVEQGDSSAVLDRLSPAFVANENMDRQALRGLMYVYFRRYPAITVSLQQIEVQLLAQDPRRARASALALLSGGEGALPQDGRLLQLESAWVLQDDRWLLNDLEWR